VAERKKKDNWILIDRILRNALQEDIGNGDVTTSLLIPENQTSKSVLTAKGHFIVAGLPYAQRVFQLVDNEVAFHILHKESSPARPGTVIAEISGSTRSILLAERTALNLLQRMCGIATLTHQFVKAVGGLKVKIADTRKTVPGLRFFDKYAVRAGGGHNHRYGLYDGILIKDNHIEAVGGVGRAVKAARSKAHHLLKVEVEVNTLSGIKEALSAGADVIMLDNMAEDKMKKAVNAIRTKRPEVLIEASGNINLENVRRVAETGVDLISIGALTHSAPAADISLGFSLKRR